MYKGMTFLDYLQLGVDEGMWGDSPELDFAIDALADKNFRDFETWQELEAYLVFNARACSDAVKAAKVCFKQWRKYIHRKGEKRAKEVLGY
jgi:hypothetical protein